MAIYAGRQGYTLAELEFCRAQKHKPSSYEIVNNEVSIGCNLCGKKWVLSIQEAYPHLDSSFSHKNEVHKTLGLMRGAGHALNEWSDEELQQLRQTADQLAAKAAVEIVKRSRSVGPTV